MEIESSRAVKADYYMCKDELQPADVAMCYLIFYYHATHLYLTVIR